MVSDSNNLDIEPRQSVIRFASAGDVPVLLELFEIPWKGER